MTETLQQLVAQRNLIYGEIIDYISTELLNIMTAGENMAECATNIQGHGYFAFISSREQFLEKTRNLQQELETLNIRTH
jgi:hypothetical protein